MIKKYDSVAYDLGTYTDSLDGEVYRLNVAHDPLDLCTEIYSYKEHDNEQLSSLEIVNIPNHKLRELIEALQGCREKAAEAEIGKMLHSTFNYHGAFNND